MAITLTENAAKQIRKQLAKRGKGLAIAHWREESGLLRVCLHIRLCGRIRAGDQMFESYDASVVVDAGSLPFLDGSRVDFVREGLNDSFRVENPNVDNTCGCGESFSLKEPAKV